MTSDTALEIVRSWYDSGNTELLSDTFTCKAIGYPVSRSDYVGKGAMINDFFGEIKAQFSQWALEVERVAGTDRDVTVLGTYLAVSSEGVSFTLPFIHVWTIDDHRLTSVVAMTHMPSRAAPTIQH